SVLTNVLVLDDLDEHLTDIRDWSDVSIQEVGGPRQVPVLAVYDEVNHRLSWFIEALPAGFTGQLKFWATIADTAQDGQEITNVFRLISDQTQEARVSNEVALAVGAARFFVLTKKAERDTVEVGDPLRYFLELRNTSANSMTNVTITDSLPRGFRYVPGTAFLD